MTKEEALKALLVKACEHVDQDGIFNGEDDDSSSDSDSSDSGEEGEEGEESKKEPKEPKVKTLLEKIEAHSYDADEQEIDI
jgi:hypothetical protein